MIASIIIHKPPRDFLERMKKSAKIVAFFSLTEIVCALKEKRSLTEKGLLVTFDHAYKELAGDFSKALLDLGIKPTLFFHTWPVQQREKDTLDWDSIARLAEEGWSLQAHTHTHTPFIAQCAAEDYVFYELEHNNSLIKKYTGNTPRHFAYPGGEFSANFEEIIRKQYDSASLWVVSPEINYNGVATSWHDFYSISSGSYYPVEALYITDKTDPYRLPRVEMTQLLQDEELFYRYLAQEDVNSLLPDSFKQNKTDKFVICELVLFGKRIFRVSARKDKIPFIK